jgi:hypothetical protein
MSKFDDEYRAGVVVMLQSEGYPDNPNALGKVHEYLKQRSPYPAKTTISNWFHGVKNAPPSKKVDDKKKDMVEALQGLTWKLIDHAGQDDTVTEMTGQQTVTSIGILIDKIRLLTGLPTEIIGIMPEFVTAIQKTGEKPEDVMRRFIERSNQRNNIRQ